MTIKRFVILCLFVLVGLVGAGVASLRVDTMRPRVSQSCLSKFSEASIARCYEKEIATLDEQISTLHTVIQKGEQNTRVIDAQKLYSDYEKTLCQEEVIQNYGCLIMVRRDRLTHLSRMLAISHL